MTFLYISPFFFLLLFPFLKWKCIDINVKISFGLKPTHMYSLTITYHNICFQIKITNTNLSFGEKLHPNKVLSNLLDVEKW